MWGIVRKEWKGVSTKTKWTFTTGIAVIMLSVVLVGIGNSMQFQFNAKKDLQQKHEDTFNVPSCLF